jgi:hypothetical protein
MSYECKVMDFVILLKYCKKGEQKFANFMSGQALAQQEPKLTIGANQ